MIEKELESLRLRQHVLGQRGPRDSGRSWFGTRLELIANFAGEENLLWHQLTLDSIVPVAQFQSVNAIDAEGIRKRRLKDFTDHHPVKDATTQLRAESKNEQILKKHTVTPVCNFRASRRQNFLRPRKGWSLRFIFLRQNKRNGPMGDDAE